MRTELHFPLDKMVRFGELEMKKVTMALIACCVALTLSAQAPQTGVEIAPSLTAIEHFSPETHRVLADGTYDTMSTEQRVEVVAAFLKEMARANPEAVEEIERNFEEMRESLEATNSLTHPPPQDDVDTMLLHLLEGMDTTYSVLRRLGLEREHLDLRRDDIVEEAR